MSTRRVPIHREPVRKISDQAVRIFRQMQHLERSCTCLPASIRARQCDACDQWWAAHSRLHDELGCKPWEWPCVEPPGPVPSWEANPAEFQEAQQRYVKLEKMAGAK